MASQADVVAQVTALKGKVLVEAQDGKRRLVKLGESLVEGSNLIVLEKATVALNYKAAQCQITHPAGTLLTVSKTAPCAAGQGLAVGQAAAAKMASRKFALTGMGMVVPIVSIVTIVAVGKARPNNGIPASR